MYTVNSCSKCGRFYKSFHGGRCPVCGGGLQQEAVNEIMWNQAQP